MLDAIRDARSADRSWSEAGGVREWSRTTRCPTASVPARPGDLGGGRRALPSAHASSRHRDRIHRRLDRHLRRPSRGRRAVPSRAVPDGCPR
ncbi:MAG: hypothetical protein EA389_02975 [Ilumatobacter sp.]|nr:MAG: hypothetical protein EA389_02975 [Ilumatobacter sp.]